MKSQREETKGRRVEHEAREAVIVLGRDLLRDEAPAAEEARNHERLDGVGFAKGIPCPRGERARNHARFDGGQSSHDAFTAHRA